MADRKRWLGLYLIAPLEDHVVVRVSRGRSRSGDTSTACADITDYLGLLKAQTGKTLSASTTTKLRNDANNLADALGCT